MRSEALLLYRLIMKPEWRLDDQEIRTLQTPLSDNWKGARTGGAVASCRQGAQVATADKGRARSVGARPAMSDKQPDQGCDDTERADTKRPQGDEPQTAAQGGAHQ